MRVYSGYWKKDDEKVKGGEKRKMKYEQMYLQGTTTQSSHAFSAQWQFVPCSDDGNFFKSS